MFHKIKSVTPLPNMTLSVCFTEGITKTYDVKPLLSKWEAFNALKSNDLFRSVYVETGGYGIVWNDDIDLSCDELYSNGVTVKTAFDGLMSFSDATEMWGLHESTLRKAVQYGNLVNGVDVCKYGKQWVVSTQSMIREYGQPK